MRVTARLGMAVALGWVAILALGQQWAQFLEASVGLASATGAVAFFLGIWALASLTLWGSVLWARSAATYIPRPTRVLDGALATGIVTPDQR